MIVQAVKRGKLLWLAEKAAKWISLNLRIDPETKQWRISSKPMWAPEFQVRTYEDIARIFKSDPASFKVSEVRDAGGKLKSFVVETQ